MILSQQNTKAELLPDGIARVLTQKEFLGLRVKKDVTSIGVIGVIYKKIAGVPRFRFIKEKSSYDKMKSGKTEPKSKFASGHVRSDDFTFVENPMFGTVRAMCREIGEEALLRVKKIRFLAAVKMTTSTDKSTHYKGAFLIEEFTKLQKRKVVSFEGEKTELYFKIKLKIDEFGAYYEIKTEEIPYVEKPRDPNPDEILGGEWHPIRDFLTNTIIPRQLIFLEKAMSFLSKKQEIAMELYKTILKFNDFRLPDAEN